MGPPVEDSATATVSRRSIKRAAIFSAFGRRCCIGVAPCSRALHAVMAGLVPAIHALLIQSLKKDADGPANPGDDAAWWAGPVANSPNQRAATTMISTL